MDIGDFDDSLLKLTMSPKAIIRFIAGEDWIVVEDCPTAQSALETKHKKCWDT